MLDMHAEARAGIGLDSENIRCSGLRSEQIVN